MYDGDTFFNLSIWGRIGLVILSITLSAMTIALFYIVAKRQLIASRMITAMVFLWVFIWLSPQIYYLYYMLLFDGLELQNVIHLPPSAQEIWAIMSFSDKVWLSSHAKALLGWSMIILSFLMMRRKSGVK